MATRKTHTPHPKPHAEVRLLDEGGNVIDEYGPVELGTDWRALELVGQQRVRTVEVRAAEVE